MSEIRATTISDAAGTGPITLTGQSAAKAWVNFNGTGTPAARDSTNVASITDNGTGDYTINFSNNLSSTDYCFVGSAEYQSASTSVNHFSLKDNGTTFKLASSFRGEGYYVDSGANRTNFDFEQINLLLHGDLA